MEAVIAGRRHRLDASKSIGKGGEADVFALDAGRAVKIFKKPSHPDYVGQAGEQLAAKERIEAHQRKLAAFPKILPSHVVGPDALAHDRSGRVIGYVMRLIDRAEVLLRYGDKGFRANGPPNSEMGAVLRDLHQTVTAIHAAGAVIGDFNDLNVLVRGSDAYLIDADSMQYGGFACRLYTTRFVDPALCDPKASSPVLAAAHTPDSDWYAFAIMVMQSLLLVGPYGGVYRPRNKSKRVAHDARPLHRITVFHPEVRYPKPAIPYGVLPDDVLQLFHQIFEKDQRGQFPASLFGDLRWTTCSACGAEHARSRCPACAEPAPAAVRQTVTVRGNVTATRIFRTSGRILYATVQNGRLLYLYREGDNLRREDTSRVAMPAPAQARYRISGRRTLVGVGNMVEIHGPRGRDRLRVSTFMGIPMFEADADRVYWIENGHLMHEGALAGEHVGNVLDGQTIFWTGGPSTTAHTGFGFYRAGSLSVAFVFRPGHRTINDSVDLGIIRGQLVDANCLFGADRIWVFIQTSERGRRINRCYVVRPDGSVTATAEAQEGSAGWLGTLHAKCASGNFLLCATDDGIVRIEAPDDQISVVREFPDTEPFVDTSCGLFVGKDGLHAVSAQEVRLLKIA